LKIVLLAFLLLPEWVSQIDPAERQSHPCETMLGFVWLTPQAYHFDGWRLEFSTDYGETWLPVVDIPCSTFWLLEVAPGVVVLCDPEITTGCFLVKQCRAVRQPNGIIKGSVSLHRHLDASAYQDFTEMFFRGIAYDEDGDWPVRLGKCGLWPSPLMEVDND